MSELRESKSIEISPAYAPVFALEEELLKMDQVEIPLLHDFCDGIYSRTIIVPKGAVVTGHVHSKENFWVVRAGSAVIYTPTGPQVFHAGHLGMSPAGHKIAGYALSEVIFTTFHANPDNDRDLDVIVDRYTFQPTQEQIENLMEKESLEIKPCQ
tara:strand:- start:576 stop:1040 length:465 start_codon:yes stop_codon:yes gene_type:complete